MFHIGYILCCKDSYFQLKCSVYWLHFCKKMIEIGYKLLTSGTECVIFVKQADRENPDGHHQ